ncbi:MAG TPA: phosphoribosyltransferase family protein [Dermatophilaceae bacterium]
MFRDRTDAGRHLAEMVAGRLSHAAGLQGIESSLVLGLPRGGVPVAAVVADALGLPLDVLVVRKVGVPWQPELALGAVGEDGAVVLNGDVVSAGGVGPDELDDLISKAAHEVEDVVAQLRPVTRPLDVRDRMAIVVDDGVATGATARAAASVLRRSGSGPVILATPVAALSTAESLHSCFDEVVCTLTPWRFGSVGQYYEHFEQVSIAQVRRLLEGSPG